MIDITVVMKTSESCVVMCFLRSRCCNSVKYTPLILDYDSCLVLVFIVGTLVHNWTNDLQYFSTCVTKLRMIMMTMIKLTTMM